MVAILSGGIVISLTLFHLVGSANGGFGIQDPLPKNQYPIEHTPVEVTCVAYDKEGVKTPKQIQFLRKNDKNNSKSVLSANDKIYFTKRTEDNGRKLFVTLHIRNVTTEDDSEYSSLPGMYMCHAYAVDNTKSNELGFSVTVIERKEIPKIETTKIGVLRRGDWTKISCRITERGSEDTELKYISWLKDGDLLGSARPVKNSSAILELEVNTSEVKNAGNYTCLLGVKLRGVRDHNESDSTIVKIKPWFEKEQHMEAGIAGTNVNLQCSARGFPLNVVWKVIRKTEDQTITECINPSTNNRYKISRKGVYDPFVLSITNLNTTDNGNYYCCLASNCSANIEELCEDIRLYVIDPLSTTTMALASRSLILAMFVLAAAVLSL